MKNFPQRLLDCKRRLELRAPAGTQNAVGPPGKESIGVGLGAEPQRDGHRRRGDTAAQGGAETLDVETFLQGLVVLEELVKQLAAIAEAKSNLRELTRQGSHRDASKKANTTRKARINS